MKCFDQVKISALMIRSFKASQSIPTVDTNSILHLTLFVFLLFFYATYFHAMLLKSSLLEQWRESAEGMEEGLAG